MKVTQQQIAEEAGVSPSAVSFALNGTGRLDNTTRERIRAVAREMGYRLKTQRRRLKEKGSGLIGVCTWIVSDCSVELVNSIQDALTEASYSVVLARGRNRRVSAPQIQAFIDHQVEGVIFRPFSLDIHDAHLAELIVRDIPVVTVDVQMKSETYNLDFAGTDDRLCGAMAAEHLLELGHRRIAVLATVGSLPEGTFDLRINGFVNAVQAVGGKIEMVEAVRRAHTEESFVQICTETLQRPDRPTAIFAPNDMIAVDAYKAAHTLGLRIPDDVSIIGVSNDRFCNYLTPGLTTIDQNPIAIGRRAVEMLLARINGTAPAAATLIHRQQPTLCMNGSTSALPQT